MRAFMVVALLAQSLSDGARCYEGRDFGTAKQKEIPCPKVDIRIFASEECDKARVEAIERVREAWAPRPPKHDPNTFAMTVVGAGDACWQQCVDQECGIPSARSIDCARSKGNEAQAR